MALKISILSMFLLISFSCLAISEVDLYCGEDVYKSGGNQSPIYSSIMSSVEQMKKNRGKILSESLWSVGSVGVEPLRNGDAIFQTAANLIRSAENEVLIQTFIYDYQSPGTFMIHDAIYDLEKRQKEREKKGIKIKPIKVKILLDDLYYMGKLRFQVLGAISFGKRSYPKKDKVRGYGLNLRVEPLDPKYVELEIRNWYNVNWGISHSKTFVIDREIAVVTGANFVSYHHSKENVGNEESMLDHGFVVAGRDSGRAFTEDFYHLFNNSIYHTKDAIASGKSTVIRALQVLFKEDCLCWGNIFGNDYDVAFKRKGDKKHPVLKYTDFSNFPPNPSLSKSMKLAQGNLGVLTREPNDIDGKKIIENEILMRRKNVGKNIEAFWETPKKHIDLSPQNMGWISAIRSAKNNINIVTPNICSFDIFKEVFNAVLRGVNVRILTNSVYEDDTYETHHELGSNQNALKLIEGGLQLYKNKALKKGTDPSQFGAFEVRWFRKRSGALSGAEQYKVNRSYGIEKYKQWNLNHTKFMTVDNQVVITGSGNLDSQSYHVSGETNFIFDNHNISSYWCKKVFAEDFLIGHPAHDKKILGDYCYLDNECQSGLCDNLMATQSLKRKECLLGQSCICIAKNNTAKKGEFCNNTKQCLKNLTCIKHNCQ